MCCSWEDVRGVIGRWMKSSYSCFLQHCIDRCNNWYPIAFAALPPASLCVCLSLPPATKTGNKILHLPLDLCHSLSAFCLLLYCLCHLFLYFSLCSLCHLVICFISAVSLSCHTPTFLFSPAQTRTYIFSSVPRMWGGVCSPHMACQLTAESVGGVLHSNLARRREKKKKKRREIICQMVGKHTVKKHIYLENSLPLNLWCTMQP